MTTKLTTDPLLMADRFEAALNDDYHTGKADAIAQAGWLHTGDTSADSLRNLQQVNLSPVTPEYNRGYIEAWEAIFKLLA